MGKEQNVIANDESSFDWDLQSRDPQEGIMFNERNSSGKPSEKINYSKISE